jgi:hypothetical protein
MNRIAVALVAIALSAPAVAAVAPTDDARRISSQYSSWAGGKANADALVAGMQNGTTVMITTQGPDNTRSLAGFTPDSKMSTEEIASALARARSSLASMGVKQPSADQIQAALIGGEVSLAGGRTKAVQGSVGHTQEPVALR